MGTLNGRLYYVSVGVGLLGAALIAVVFGYLSPDSWYYMLIAQSLRQGQGCALYGQYLAAYPCGYPLALALTSPQDSLPVLMVWGKVTNLLLMAGSFTLLLGALRHRLAAALCVLNPVTLHIFMYTWSENLFLFAFAGVFFALTRLAEAHNSRRYMAALCGFLLIGCFARYVFGPFALILFLIVWRVYGRALALKVLPAFVGAGAVYLLYQQVNIHLTGYPTGMERIPAPESLWFLIETFFEVLGGLGWSLLLAVAGLLILSFRQIGFSLRSEEGAGYRRARFLILAGAGFLLLAFVLRARTYYDSYDLRTLGFGAVFIVAGLVARFVKVKFPMGLSVAAAVLIVGVVSGLYADDDSIVFALGHLRAGQYRFAPTALADMKRKGPEADAIVTFGIPRQPPELWNVENIRHIYYGPRVKLIYPALSPDSAPQTAQSFVAEIADAASVRCYVDFQAYASAQDFQAYLDGATPIDGAKQKPWFDPGLKAYLARIFSPGAFISCREILARPESRALLTKATGRAATFRN